MKMSTKKKAAADRATDAAKLLENGKRAEMLHKI
jgi:hypothetical protein